MVFFAAVVVASLSPFDGLTGRDTVNATSSSGGMIVTMPQETGSYEKVKLYIMEMDSRLNSKLSNVDARLDGLESLRNSSMSKAEFISAINENFVQLDTVLRAKIDESVRAEGIFMFLAALFGMVFGFAACMLLVKL